MSNRTRLALFTFFPGFVPPKSGGEQRAYHGWRSLAEEFDVTVVSPTFGEAKRETVEHTPHLREHRIPKKGIHTKWHVRLDRLGGFPECSALVVSLAGRHDSEFMEAIEAALADAEIVVIEGPFFPYLKPRADQLVVYSSYNVEYKLQAQTWSGLWAKPAVAWVKRNERRLVQRADLIFACSEKDRDIFINDLGALPEGAFVVPNGTVVSDLPAPATHEAERIDALRSLSAALESEPIKQRIESFFNLAPLAIDAENGTRAPSSGTISPRAIFMGSKFPPNVEAARLIESEIAPANPDTSFFIAGSCCSALTGEAPPNVFRLGFLPEKNEASKNDGGGSAKNDFLKMAHLALNPMLAGSGTNVKMLDFFGAGLPALATPTGARGLEIYRGEGLFIAEPEELSTRLNELLSHPAELAAAGHLARRRTESEFDWRVIGHNEVEAIKHRFAAFGTATTKQSDADKKRRAKKPVLICTDYEVWPPIHGGKQRIYHQAKALAAQGHSVTILSLNDQGLCGSQICGLGIVETTIPRTRRHNRIDDSIEEVFARNFSAEDLTCWMHPELMKPYRAALKRLAPQHRAAIISHPYLARFIPQLKADMPPHALIIHDSHNVEAKLKAQLLGPIAETNPKAASWKKRLIQAASETERAAVKGSDFILSVSENEVKELEQIYSVDRATLRAAPNGVDAQTTRPPEPTERETLRRRLGIAAGQTVAIFIGSAHLPNIEAARFIFDELAPGVPGVLFIIAGEVARTLPQTSKRQNMRLISPLSEELKHELLKIADVGLNPTEAGSGTNLKSVETMAAGHLLLTTPNGARGLPLTHGREAVILPRRMFAPALNTLTSEPEHVQQIRTNGRILAEQEFDWPHTMSPLIELLDQH